MRLALVALFTGLLVATAAGGWLAFADQGKVTGTVHDLGSPGSGGVSSCETCHVPHESAGDVLWETDPREGEEFSGIAPVCYSCHDGSVATGSFVFDKETVRHTLDRQAGQDCDMCHDPHDTEYGNFLLFPSGANLCQTCHEEASGQDHPVNVNVHQAGVWPLDTDWAPEEGDLSGTRLWDAMGRPGAEYTKCLTCHAAHGGTEDSLLATKDTHGAGVAICQNCHTGGGLR